MLEVSSSTSLAILFQSLQFAANEVDRRAVTKAVEDAARRPVQRKPGCFEEEIRPHLTYYAATRVKMQFDLQHNYESAIKQMAGDDTEYYVWDRRAAVVGQPEEKREVQVKVGSMRCSCGFPQTHLLPCRHVLVINLRLYRTPFQHQQVGQRWLKYYRPLPSSPINLSDEPPPVQPSAISSQNTALVQAGTAPDRRARYGQIMGYCLTICTRAADFKHLFHTALAKVEDVARWIEAATTATGLSSMPLRLTMSSASAALTGGQEQVVLPSHLQKQKGKQAEKRQKGAAEKEQGKKAKLSASQTC
jgi:hypothetical protein